MKLPSITGSAGHILLLKLDEPIRLAEKCGLELEQPVQKAHLLEAISQAVKAFSPLATGVLLSAELGFDARKQITEKAGRVFCLEKTVLETDPLSIPVLQTNWNVEYVRNNSALAKLTLFARYDEEELITKLELVNELYDSCRYEGIDFLLELRIIDGKRLSDSEFQEEQLHLLRLFRQQADAFLLEYPRTALGCLTVTGELRRPWVLLEPEKTEYPEVKESLRTALAGGAIGFAASSLLFPEFKRDTFQLSELQAFLQKEGRDRVVELARICTEGTLSVG